MNNVKHDFSLVELLIVIAVITILAALLFPSFGKIKESAKGTSCANKVRDIMLTMNTYISDCGYFPYCEGDLTVDGSYSGRYGPLYGGGYIPREKVASTVATPKSPYACPSDPKGYFNFQYNMYNGFIGNAGSASYTWRYNPGVKMVNQKFPKKTAVILERDNGTLSREVWDNNKTTLLSNRVNSFIRGMRHNGNANMLYVDGHVGRISDVPMMQRDDPFFNRLY